MMSTDRNEMDPAAVAALDAILDDDGPDILTEGVTAWEAAGSPVVADDE